MCNDREDKDVSCNFIYNCVDHLGDFFSLGLIKDNFVKVANSDSCQYKSEEDDRLLNHKEPADNNHAQSAVGKEMLHDMFLKVELWVGHFNN